MEGVKKDCSGVSVCYKNLKNIRFDKQLNLFTIVIQYLFCNIFLIFKLQLKFVAEFEPSFFDQAVFVEISL